MKEATNHVPMNIIDLAQTSRKIIEGGDVPIFLVFLSTPDSPNLCDCTGIPLSTLYAEVNTIFT